MRFLLIVLVVFFSWTLYAMHDAKEYAQLVRSDVAQTLEAQDKKGYQQHLMKARLNTQRALQSNPNGLTSELNVYNAFFESILAFQENNCDKALSSCVDVLNGPCNTKLLAQVRGHTFHLVQTLADEREHTISQFYLMKHLLNAKSQTNVQEGLKRFHGLFARNLEEEDYAGMAVLFKASEILLDIQKLADTQANAHAQCIMAEYHLFLAERGKEMDGTPTEPRAELKKAFAYAQKLVAGNYEQAHEYLTRIETALQQLQEARVRIVSSNDESMPALTPVCKIVPLKVLCSLVLYKKSLENDHRQLYVYAKKLLNDPDDHIYSMGLEYLKKAAELGNPFAAERLGDALHERKPELAAAYYCQALHTYRHAKNDSYWRFVGCFRRSDIERKVEQLAARSDEVAAYQNAWECGQAAARERWVFDGKYNKKHIDRLVGIVHEIEKKYINNKYTIDTLHLQLIATSGVMAFFDLFKKDKPIQDVLINILALRAHLKRGYVLKDATRLAHYKKALHIILDPDGFAQQQLDEPVPHRVLLKAIAIDALPVQQRIIYLEAIIGVIEELVEKGVGQKKESQYVCQLFSLVDQAIRRTEDRYLYNLFFEKYYALFDVIRKAALCCNVHDHVRMIGMCYADVGVRNNTIEVLEEADRLLTHISQGKTKKDSTVCKKLSQVKAARAQACVASHDIEVVCSLYKSAVRLCPDDIEIQWNYAQFLMESGQMALRTQGLGIIEKLAYTHKHCQAMVFLVEGYFGRKSHVMIRDEQKAIPLLQQLVQTDPPERFIHRLMLAKLYMEQALSAEGQYQKKLMAKAQDLVHPYKNSHNAAHLMYLNMLCSLGRDNEVVHELKTYKLASDISESDLFELVKGYAMLAKGQNAQLAKVLRAKAMALAQQIKDSSEQAYLFLLTELLEQGYHDQLVQEIVKEKQPYMNCIKECYLARSLLLKEGVRRIDVVVNHCERAFEAFEDHFLRRAAYDARELWDLIASVGVSECVALTHHMKETSLVQLEKVVEHISQVIIEGVCDDHMRERAIAFNAYFATKIALLRLGYSATYENVLKLFGISVNHVCKAGDISCKRKILELACDQIRFWLDTSTAGSLAMRTKTAVAFLLPCVKLCKDEEDALLSRAFHDIVIYTDTMSRDLDLSSCPHEDLVTVQLQQQIIARIAHDFIKK